MRIASIGSPGFNALTGQRPLGVDRVNADPAPDAEAHEQPRPDAREAGAGQARDSKSYMEKMLSQLEDANASADALGDAMDVEIKCMIIASRIMRGHKVPKADHQFLMKNKPELYMKALMLRTLRKNPKPKKYKRLSEEEEKEDSRISSANDASRESDADQDDAAVGDDVGLDASDGEPSAPSGGGLYIKA
ncbi:hypothetical protein ACH6CV_03840 [Bacillota bacterium Meth-B3]